MIETIYELRFGDFVYKKSENNAGYSNQDW